MSVIEVSFALDLCGTNTLNISKLGFPTGFCGTLMLIETPIIAVAAQQCRGISEHI